MRAFGTCGQGHEGVELEYGLVGLAAARPRLEAFVEHLRSSVWVEKGTERKATDRTTGMVVAAALGVSRLVELLSASLVSAPRHPVMDVCWVKEKFNDNWID